MKPYWRLSEGIYASNAFNIQLSIQQKSLWKNSSNDVKIREKMNSNNNKKREKNARFHIFATEVNVIHEQIIEIYMGGLHLLDVSFCKA